MQRTAGGFSVILILVFSGVFITIVSSLAGFIFMQQRVQLAKENRERAVQIAEAGLDYYKWYLAHYPGDTTNGTGEPGPYEHEYADPESGATGTFSLTLDGNEQCDITSAIDVASTGWTDADPSFTRTVRGRYARPSVAEYAYILNSNVWVGSDQVIIGPYHSNGGIRMDGDNRSKVTSAVANWQCSATFGCSPTAEKSGVFGTGTNPLLWSYPVPNIDFEGITVDLNTLRDVANDLGLFFNPYGGVPEQRGYHFIFKSDGSVDVYRVTNTSFVWSYRINTGAWDRSYEIITDENFMGNYVIPPACGVIISESKAWIEGVVKGKITIAAANLWNPNVDLDVILSGDLTYAADDGTNAVTVIGEDSVIIPLNAPDNMQLRGIFIAQKGYFGRDHYTTTGTHKVPAAYNTYVKRNNLNIIGTVVSNGRVGTKWFDSNNNYISGFAQRNHSYDRNLALDPPPLTPSISEDYKFIEWRED